MTFLGKQKERDSSLYIKTQLINKKSPYQDRIIILNCCKIKSRSTKTVLQNHSTLAHFLKEIK